MDEKFLGAQWIWNSYAYKPDEYVEFKFNFVASKLNKTCVRIASDSNYNLYVNGNIAAFGQYADYPNYKVYDEIDVTEYLNGENEVYILVWYYGIDTQTYIKDNPGVIFEIESDGKIIYGSGAHVKSRLCLNYQNHRAKNLTSQLGLTFKYLANVENQTPYSESVVIQKSKNLFARPNEKLILRNGEKNVVTLLNDGSYLVDMGRETCGFLKLDFESDEEQDILVAYSQYLDGGKVKRLIGGMDFSVEYFAKKGKNEYVNYFRRLSGRYLQLFASKPIKINYVGICSVEYPVVAKKPNFKSELRNRIYDVSVRTLHCCMHEHYEDTPWREQALYTMDSRNEMLCTYYAFNDFKFARSNLVLISKGLRSDGLLSICYPAGRDIPIPFFSLVYSVQVKEYIEYSGDLTILNEVLPVLEKIYETFKSRIEGNGLIANFPYPYWNFYEWTNGSDNGSQISRKATDFYPKKYDLILNCMFLMSLINYKQILALEGKTLDFDEEKTCTAIKETFFVKERGLFKATDIDEPYYTVLGNCLAVLCGIGDEKIMENVLSDKEIVSISLSMCTFLYEALLKVDAKKYVQYIVDDIDMRYGSMLKRGATTFWETEEGASSLAHTGSLCHGWSAMPIYYYSILNGKDYFDGQL